MEELALAKRLAEEAAYLWRRCLMRFERKGQKEWQRARHDHLLRLAERRLNRRRVRPCTLTGYPWLRFTVWSNRIVWRDEDGRPIRL